jgi:glycosyltransferase involved in cell wall biosynthesis
VSFTISIVTATRNRATLLPRCLDAVAAQHYADKEHVVIDGASTDGTKELLEEYGRNQPHLKWISEPDRGLSDAFNKGLKLASGDCIGVIGDDDWYEDGAFEIVADLFARHPEAGMISGGCNHVRTDGSLISTQPARFSNRHELIQCWKHWGKSVSLPAPSTFIRREVIETVGGFEECDKYAMDYRHWIKITEKFQVVTTPHVLANFRSDEGTISFSQNEKQWQETIAISRAYWGGGLQSAQMFASYAPYAALRSLKNTMRPVVRRLRQARP